MALRDNMHSALVEHGAPLCDDCVWQRAGMTSRQQANSRGRELLALGVIRRGQGTCSVCGGAKTVSVPTDKELPPTVVSDHADAAWHWEGHVQAALVAHLRASGWDIKSEANTATKESGVDVVAVDPEGSEWWITVKGYPERKPGKTTNPATQARHWFSAAMFDVVRYRTADPTVRLGVALPHPFVTYEGLTAQSTWLRDTAPFAYFLVDQVGGVRIVGD